MPPGICQIGLMRFHAFNVTVANANRAALSVKVLKDHLATNSLGVLASSLLAGGQLVALQELRGLVRLL